MTQIQVFRILALITLVAGIIFGTIYYGLSGSAASTNRTNGPSTPSEQSKANIAARYGKRQLSFEENKGQTDPRVKFLSRGSAYNLFLTADGVVLTLRKPHTQSSDKFNVPTQIGESNTPIKESSVLRLTTVNANHESLPDGEDQLSGKVNYLFGNDANNWHTNIPTYRKVHYRDIYPGVDVIYYGNQRQLEYDFVVAAGADPSVIKFKVDGADRIGLDKDGDLTLTLKDGEVRLHKPLIYQTTETNGRSEIKGEYVIKNNEIGFKIQSFDSRKPLIIDPVLSYATFLGGGGNEYAYGIAVDSQGNAYVTGATDVSNFPVTPGAFQTSAFGGAFVSKMNAAGTDLIYSTYLSGGSGATGTAIAVDGSGNAFVTGWTSSADFPTANPIRGGRYNLLKSVDAGSQWTPNSIGSINAPVLALALDKVTPSTIYAGTSFGGSGVFKSLDSGNSWSPLNTGVANASCPALVIDPTNSNIIYAALTPSNFTNAGVFKSTNGGDTWISMSSGLNNFSVTALAIDPQNPSTLYAGTQFGIYKTTNGGASWVSSSSGINFGGFFSIIVDPSTPTTIYASAGGGGVFKTTNGAANWAQVNTGLTNTTVRTLIIDPTSTSTLFAGTVGGGVFKTTNGGGNWTAVNNGLPSNTSIGSAVLNPGFPSTIYMGGLAGQIFKTTNGGDNWTKLYDNLSSTRFNALAIDPTVTATVYAGVDTSSQSLNDYEAFATKVNANGSGLLYSTYIGGSGNDYGQGIAVDSTGAASIVGETRSTNLPVLNANQSSFGGPDGCGDGFVTKLNAAGSAFVFSSYLGGNGCDVAYAVAVDSPGNVYVTGLTTSSNFPVANAFQSNSTGQFNSDAFCTKFSGNGSLAYSTYLGGNGSDTGYAIAVDGSGNAYITGTTTSTNFPTVNPIQPTNAGFDGDVFVTKLNNLGSGLVYSTYLGGSSTDVGRGIAVDSTNNAYVTGFTRSLDFPLVAGAIRTKSPLFKSVEGAAIWSNDNYGLKAAISDLLVDPVQISTVYAATQNGIFKSTNSGRTWVPIDNGLNNLNIFQLVIDPLTPTRLYAAANGFGSGNGGIYRTLDGGNNWTLIGNGITNTLVLSLAIDPVTPMTLYSGTYGGPIFKTSDGGDHWAPAGNSFNIYAGAMSVDPLNHATVFAADTVTSDGGVFKSTDSGVTWQNVGANPVRPRGQFIAISPFTPGLLYASGFNGVFKSIDGGATWSLIRQQGGRIVFDPVNASTLYLASPNEGVLKSIDNAQTWIPMNKGLRTPSATALAVNPVNPSILYTAGSGSNDDDAFVTKINSSGNALIYSTFLGGSPSPGDSLNLNDEGFAIAIDSTGNAYVTGLTRSPDFATTPDAYQPLNRGSSDAFIAKLSMSYIISGHVLDGVGAAVSGCEVVLNDGVSLTSVFTESDGYYEFSHLREGGTFTVSAAKANFTIAPTSQTFSNLTGNQVLDFITTPSASPFHIVSGQITENAVGLAGVKVTLTGSQVGIRITDSNGNYSFTLPAGGSYTVTPSKLAFNFTTPNQTFNNLGANQTANFAATRQNFVVTNNNDHGAGSLRQAMLDANENPGADTIVFNIPGSGIHTINVLLALPEITDPVVIDATTQPGYSGSPLVELNGLQSGGASGLVVKAGNSTLRGLSIYRFGGFGIWLYFCDHNVIQGNYVGLDAAGTGQFNNEGIHLSDSSNNLIGGTTSAARNIISGNNFDGMEVNGSNNVVQGNFIGTNPAGMAAVPNGINGITISGSPGTNNLIGGTSPAAGNLISGNQRGIDIHSPSNTVQGNLIGTDVTGTKAIANGTGISAGPNDTLIGGLTSAARNIISGNNGDGVDFGGTGSRLQGNFIGTDITGTVALGNGGSGVGAGTHALIGGTTPEARNVISGNGGFGNISLGSNNAGDGAVVQGNYIGTDVTGNFALSGVSFSGISIAGVGHMIGGTVPGATNVISGNRLGIQIGGFITQPPTGNIIQGNIIGLNALGTTPLPNAFGGISVDDANNNVIGGTQSQAGNRINFNGGPGVSVFSGSGNSIRGNSIFSNVGLGIDLAPTDVNANDPGDTDTGANDRQNFPVLTTLLSAPSSTTIQGTLNSKPNTTFQIDFYSNAGCDPSGNGEGGQFFNSTSVTTDGSGNATIDVSFPISLDPGRAITATATDPGGSTSEFSPCNSSTAAGSFQFAVSASQVIEDVAVAKISVLRLGGSSGSLSVNYSTTDGTATAGQDYTSSSGTLNFGPGEMNKTIQIPIADDGITEPDETFTIRLDSSSLTSLGIPNVETVTIQDHGTIPSLAINSVNVLEGDSGTTDALFTVSLSAATGRSISVNYATSNQSATGGASCGNLIDYVTTSGTLFFQPGDTSITLPVKVCGEKSAEANETFVVTLSNPSNATLSFSQGLGRILNDDVLRLVLDESGPAADQAAALESILATRDPFHVLSIADWLNLGSDNNTRLTIFAENLQLNQGEPVSAVSVNLVGTNNQFFFIPAEDVRALTNTPFTQLTFRLPNNLASGVCLVRIRAHGLTSNTGTIRIAP